MALSVTRAYHVTYKHLRFIVSIGFETSRSAEEWVAGFVSPAVLPGKYSVKVELVPGQLDRVETDYRPKLWQHYDAHWSTVVEYITETITEWVAADEAAIQKLHEDRRDREQLALRLDSLFREGVVDKLSGCTLAQ